MDKMGRRLFLRHDSVVLIWNTAAGGKSERGQAGESGRIRTLFPKETADSLYKNPFDFLDGMTYNNRYNV